MDYLEYDNVKIMQDSKIIREITKEIEADAKRLLKPNKEDLLQETMKEQDMIMDNLATEYDRLIGICKELNRITTCIENTRQKYRQCEAKINDLLGRVALVGNE